jgi:hypothetical protein
LVYIDYAKQVRSPTEEDVSRLTNFLILAITFLYMGSAWRLGIISTTENLIKNKNHTFSIQPGQGACYDYFGNGYNAKKSAWLIPHVIKYKEDSEIITWRCNWGDTCESTCLYAINKNGH